MAAPARQHRVEVTIKAHQQEKDGDTYKLDGDVEISFQTYVMRAEHVVYNSESGGIEATGGVVLDGGPHDAHISANRAVYNVKTEDGNFYDVTGTFGAKARGRSVVLTTDNPFVIAGKEVRKVGRDRFIVFNGSITSCAAPKPNWTFNAEKIDVVAGDNAKIYHSSFRLRKIPIFYFPYAETSTSALGRQSGFLLPNVGQSSRKGYVLGDSFYWAINRSSDLTIGGEYYSRRGWSQTGEYRAKPTQNSNVYMRYYGMIDRGDPVTHQKQGGQDIQLNGDISRPTWRGVASLDYLSSLLFRQAFSETFSQAVNSEVKSVAFVSRNADGFSLNAWANRYQNFYQDPTTQSYSNQIKILHVPTVELNSLERRLFKLPIVWGVDASGGGLQRSEPGFRTANLVGRFDVQPRMAMPLSIDGWSVRPEVVLHGTYYTQQLQQAGGEPLGIAVTDPLNRRALEANVEVRPPAMERVFEGEIFGRKLKHVIEPILAYHYVSGVDRFQNVIRFDSMDILSDTNEFEYDVIQRVYSRRTVAKKNTNCDDEASAESKPGDPQYIPGTAIARPNCGDQESRRELLTWEVRQKYFVDQTFGHAVVAGRRNQFTTTEDLTGFAFLDEPRTWSPVVSKLRAQTSANTDVQWEFDYDPRKGRINASSLFAEYRLGDYFIGTSHAYFHVPANNLETTISNAPLVYNQIRWLVGYGHPDKKGFSGGASLGYDQHSDFLQYGAVQTSYNWDCCGFSLEFRRLALPGVRNENQFRFAFMLANIGTFGNLRRQERLY